MFPPAIDIPPDLYRVEISDHEMAIASSATGSVLEERPRDEHWRYESMAVVDDGPVGFVRPEETLEALNVREWHDAGHQGQGLSIAVFDVEWFGADWPQQELSFVGTHDCFAHRSCNVPIDTLHPRFGFERGVHGFACTEIINDLAPQADVHLVRVNGLTSLENAVHWAIREEIDIISMSLSFFNESFYDSTGPISDLMDELAAHDIAMVTSAGNYAQQHFRSSFRDQNLDGFHDFDNPNGLPIYLKEGKKRINLIWDEFDTCGYTDLDAYLWDENNDVIARGTRNQDLDSENCSPSERITAIVSSEGWHYLRVHQKRGNAAPSFDVMARGGVVYEAHTTNSIVDPGMHPKVLTVGAVRIDDYLFSDLESFSSQGNSEGTKPDLVGPDGLTTLSYGPKNFFGTSASTPAVAALLAVYLSKERDLSPIEGSNHLKQFAVPDNRLRSPTPQMGSGRARLPPLLSESGCTGKLSLLLPFSLLWIWIRKNPPFAR